MAIRTLHHELSEAELNAPDLDEGELDVEHYPISDIAGIEDEQLRQAWAEAQRLLSEEGDPDELAKDA